MVVGLRFVAELISEIWMRSWELAVLVGGLMPNANVLSFYHSKRRSNWNRESIKIITITHSLISPPPNLTIPNPAF